MDQDTQYGLQCFYKIKENAFGTPVIILTGSTAEDFIDQLLTSQDVVNLWGEELSLIRFSKKYNIFTDNLQKPLQVIFLLLLVCFLLLGISI